MCLPAADHELPTAHAPPGDGAFPRVFLESERNITALRNIDQWLSRNEMQGAGIFLVSRQRDDDSRSIERADTLERLERVQYNEVAAFHVGASGAGGQSVEPHEPFAVALKYSVQVADQEQTLPFHPLSLGEQVSGATNGVWQRDPAGLETERRKLGLEEFPDGPDTGQIEGATADVDRSFEEIDLLRLVSAHVVANPLLDSGQRRRSARLRGRGIRHREKQHTGAQERTRDDAGLVGDGTNRVGCHITGDYHHFAVPSTSEKR